MILKGLHWIFIAAYIVVGVYRLFSGDQAFLALPSSFTEVFDFVGICLGILVVLATGLKQQLLPVLAWRVVMLLLVVNVIRYWPNLSLLAELDSRPYLRVLFFYWLFSWVVPVIAAAYLGFLKKPGAPKASNPSQIDSGA